MPNDDNWLPRGVARRHNVGFLSRQIWKFGFLSRPCVSLLNIFYLCVRYQQIFDGETKIITVDMHHTWRTSLIISKCELVNNVSPLGSRTSPSICVSHIEFVGKSLWPMYLNKICWSSIIYFGFLTRVFCRFWVLNSGGSIHYTLALCLPKAELKTKFSTRCKLCCQPRV